MGWGHAFAQKYVAKTYRIWLKKALRSYAERGVTVGVRLQSSSGCRFRTPQTSINLDFPIKIGYIYVRLPRCDAHRDHAKPQNQQVRLASCMEAR